jgi:hypothetical protein
VCSNISPGNKVCLWLAAGQLFLTGSRYSTNKNDLDDITEIFVEIGIREVYPI